MKKFLLLSFVLLTGCESIFPQSKYLYDSPNGPVYEAYCHGTYKTLGDCYQKAGQICNGNFEIMNKSEKSYKNLENELWGESYTSADKSKVTTIKRSIVFYCAR